MKNAYKMEVNNLKVAAFPADSTAGIAGARLSMQKHEKVALVVLVGTGLASDVKVTLQQHDAPTAGNSKDLEIQNRIFVKADAATVFTEVEPTVPASTVEIPALDAVAGLAVLEVRACDLDVNNGFDHISASVGASGTAKVIGILYDTSNCKNLPAYTESI